MTKVKLSCGWASSEEITERLIKQFKTCESDVDSIEFVYDDSFDVIVFFNYVNCDTNGKKAYIFPHEPYWAGTHQKSACHDNLQLMGYDKEAYQCSENVIETLAHTFYGGRGPWVDLLSDWCYGKLESYEHVKKTCNISSIVTILNGYSNGTCLYHDRYRLIENIIDDLDFIDYYGGWIGEKSNIKSDPEKIKATIPYKFSLVIENDYHKNWITEKFYDPIICNTIPVYYGCSNIRDIYPENGYILLDNISDHSYVREKLNWINENADELYETMYPELLKIKKRYFTEYNLLKKIKTLI